MVQPAAGVLLIADPFLKDPNFMRTVVFLTEHREDGTIGFVLNRQFENTLDELLPEVEGHRIPVYYGGPVQMNTIHFLHRYPEEVPGGIEVMKGVYWGGDFDAVISLINSGLADPEKIRFYIGYSGWSSGQLEIAMDYQNYSGDPSQDLFQQEYVVYGGFWERFGAVFLDGLILLIPNFIVQS